MFSWLGTALSTLSRPSSDPSAPATFSRPGLFAPSPRTSYVWWVAGEIVAGRTEFSKLRALLMAEDDLAVAVVAATEIASLHPEAIAVLLEMDGDAGTERHGAALGGLLFCGDPRAIPAAVRSLAMRPPSVLRGLAEIETACLLVPTTEIWLQLAARFAESHDRRVEIAADALVRLVARHRGENAVSLRSLGTGGSSFQIVGETTWPAFAERVRERIAELPDHPALAEALATWSESSPR